MIFIIKKIIYYYKIKKINKKLNKPRKYIY